MRRLLAAIFAGAAFVAGVASVAPAQAASPCVTLQYLTLLGGADNALSAVPAQPAAALHDVMQAAALAPASSADLAPIIASLTRRHPTSPEANSASI